ncbi:MAG: maleylacetoacetate isomerase [Acidobacteria bacterium]|nr:maleylacetoacetate isomerase [Acidobacteriota bacterium]
MRLYSYWRSSCSYRVRLALNFLEIPCEIVQIHLVKNGGEQHQAEYKRLNPMGEVPALIDGTMLVTQSMVICDYLQAKTGGTLFPIALEDNVFVRQICEIVNSGIQPLQNLKCLQALGTRFGADDAAKADWARTWIEKGLHALEQLLAPRAGNRCLGDQTTAADCFLIPQLYNAHRYEISFNELPTLARIEASVSIEKWAQDAHPDAQPDAPA